MSQKASTCTRTKCLILLHLETERLRNKGTENLTILCTSTHTSIVWYITRSNFLYICFPSFVYKNKIRDFFNIQIYILQNVPEPMENWSKKQVNMPIIALYYKVDRNDWFNSYLLNKCLLI